MNLFLVATFGILVAEMIAFCMLVLPLPSRWRRAILKTVSTSPWAKKASSVLKIVFGFILMLFVDTINRLRRIDDGEQEHGHLNHDFGYEASMKARKFYAQRNMYLTGFTLFLSLILERTANLVIELLKREEELDELKIQAPVMSHKQQDLTGKDDAYKKQINTLKEEIRELLRRDQDYEILKKQAKEQAKEYGRLADEKKALERAAAGQPSEARKDI